MQSVHEQKNFQQIMLMCLGFFGIQFGWALQMGNMSAIYSRLGASEDQIPMLWLAAPVTGLLVQPLVGYFSDRTWCRLGRRRPYFLFGAIFSMIALFLMPQASAIWMVFRSRLSPRRILSLARAASASSRQRAAV